MLKARVSSAIKSVDLKQEVGPLIIGERLNTQGSKKAKELVLNDDFDGLVDLARTQVEDGAHCIDVCVATTERSDEKEFILKLVKSLSLEIDAPLVIDSTDPQVIESAIEQIPGKPIINSINLEGDGTRFKKLAPLMAKYGIPAIALCIGPDGMAKTPIQKVETAELLYKSGKKYGLRPEQFIFDVLTFTLATGEEEDTPEFWVEYNSYRVWQKGGQVLAGAILGTSIAALVGIVFLFARKVLPQGNNVKKTLVLSGLMWFTIFVIPFLKYPANPPTVGETETVVLRSILFLSFIAISGLGAVGFYQVYKRLQNKKILAFVGYAAFISAVFFIMPENPDEITAPMELVDGFRGASFVAVTVYWLTLGLILGGFIEKLQERLKLKN